MHKALFSQNEAQLIPYGCSLRVPPFLIACQFYSGAHFLYFRVQVHSTPLIHRILIIHGLQGDLKLGSQLLQAALISWNIQNNPCILEHLEQS
ncbi:hypothetical protein DPMN_026213 [Dreissena polymorpha]|uniref:Uncharacterized protein n=1 Tax=Dreissena polymorpha TaxID=45954 RepID=A0A9D4RD96_DREPO|nr:hypothetical protein DPMN_026213 [Dreissena polymorpha]